MGTDTSVAVGADRPRDRIAAHSKTQVGLVAFVFGPLGYALLGKWTLAVLCLVTLNWFLLGFLVAPIHCRKLIDDARHDAAD